ncbi:MAG: hypothetical protein ACP5O6_00960 [Candidatus Baltobacteraceae bacterium]
MPASAIVLNNGLIVVHNNTRVALTVRMLTDSGQTGEGIKLDPGHTFYSQRCCYAAGMQYRLYIYSTGEYDPNSKKFVGDIPGENIYFVPKLCNRHGIPYGYAEFNVTLGQVTRVNEKHGCYTVPL